MTLATRCSACGTSFRVVQDQLKVSGGWVRCGRCNEVFNALESLYEIDTQSAEAQANAARQASQQRSPVPGPAAAAPGDAAPVAPPQAAARRAPFHSPPPARPPEPQPAPAAEEAPAEPSPAAAPTQATVSALEAAAMVRGQVARPASVPETGPDEEPAQEPAQPPAAAFDLAPPALGIPPALAPAPPLPAPPVASHTETNIPPAVPLPPSEPAAWDDRPVHGFEDVETRLEPRAGDDMELTPSFMTDARRHGVPAPRKQPTLWRGLGLFLGVLLVLQLALAWRDTLAARAPALEPVLAAACRLFGCQVEAPRQMSALALEGSNLRQRGGNGGYELLVALRNRSGGAVMMPSFELTLTDSQGQPVIRRVLTPQEFGLRDPRLGPAGEVSLQALLDVNDRRIAGYTVEIFYP